MTLNNFDDFIATLLQAGFSTGSGNSEGIYAVVPFGWNENPPFSTKVRWHTGDLETDPWEWRIRVLKERDEARLWKSILQKERLHNRKMVSIFFRRPQERYGF